MRSSVRLAFIALAAAVAVASMSTAAQAFVPIDFSPGYACEGTRTVGDHTSTPGDVLTIVGFVGNFDAPLAGLDANDPTKEYTYVYTGYVSAGTSAGPFFVTTYGAGTLEVYCDAAQNADYATKSTFGDGDLIVSFSVPAFGTTTNSFNTSGSSSTQVLTVTGGSHAANFEGCSVSLAQGAFSVAASFVPAAQQAQGYFGFSDTKIDADCPVPVERSTWGGIKNLYE